MGRGRFSLKLTSRGSHDQNRARGVVHAGLRYGSHHEGREAALVGSADDQHFRMCAGVYQELRRVPDKLLVVYQAGCLLPNTNLLMS